MDARPHPRHLTAANAAKPVVVMAGFGERLGLEPGDSIAICMENHLHYFELCWAAHDTGLYFTPISSRLKTDEIAYNVHAIAQIAGRGAQP